MPKNKKLNGKVDKKPQKKQPKQIVSKKKIVQPKAKPRPKKTIVKKEQSKTATKKQEQKKVAQEKKKNILIKKTEPERKEKPIAEKKQELQKKEPVAEAQKEKPKKEEKKKGKEKNKPEPKEEIIIDKASLPKLKKPTVVHPGDSWKKVEAVLFASGKYLPEEKIAELAGLQLPETKAALHQLQEKYTSEDTTLQLFSQGNTWKLNVNEQFTSVVKNIVTEAELPTPVLETLAIIAYKTPIIQSDVINSRGTGAYEHIAMLESKGFIVREKFRRTFKLKVAEKFFDYFDVPDESKIQELFKDVKKPEVEDLTKFTEQEKENTFDQKITQRLKKLEETTEQKEDKQEFLDDFEKRIEAAKSRITTTESEISEFRKKLEDTKPEGDMFQEPKAEQGDEVKEPENEKKEFLKRIDEDPEQDG